MNSFAKVGFKDTADQARWRDSVHYLLEICRPSLKQGYTAQEFGGRDYRMFSTWLGILEVHDKNW